MRHRRKVFLPGRDIFRRQAECATRSKSDCSGLRGSSGSRHCLTVATTENEGGEGGFQINLPRASVPCKILFWREDRGGHLSLWWE